MSEDPVSPDRSLKLLEYIGVGLIVLGVLFLVVGIITAIEQESALLFFTGLSQMVLFG